MAGKDKIYFYDRIRGPSDRKNIFHDHKKYFFDHKKDSYDRIKDFYGCKKRIYNHKNIFSYHKRDFSNHKENFAIENMGIIYVKVLLPTIKKFFMVGKNLFLRRYPERANAFKNLIWLKPKVI
ncbi:MAG TPA: hypothetical protein VIH57_24580 [Bacteroidales bacterium]